MKTRCNCTGTTHYERYGGRGITYDPSWEDFTVFLADMGKKPDPKMELERIDNDKNYCKENCRWATRKEQTRNRGGKRATRLYTFEGKTLCIADWAKEVGISPQAMQKRLNNGWPFEKAFSKERHDGIGWNRVKPK
jgi:predicted nucleic acid-binding Zn ribbon protein